MKYSDYITIQDFMPVYDMKVEDEQSWRSFIPTNQFCSVLKSSLKSITTEKKTERKSIWIRGTFGTGKSHASSVIKHLLCDPKEKIEDYLSNLADIDLRENLKNIRKKKQYFPVVLKGVEGAWDIPALSLSLQRATKEALYKAGYKNIVVKSDFEAAINWVEEHKKYTEDIISKYDELSVIASTPEKIIKKLQVNDSETYLQLATALRESMDVQLSKVSISDWLEQIEHTIEEQGIANGLIIFWDEFTSVMDTIKSDRINILQNIAEKSQHCNLFLFLISHRTEQQSSDIKNKDISKMSDRFNIMDYRMDELSTYVIMRHTFRITNDNGSFRVMIYNRTESFENLMNYLNEKGTDEEKKKISDLFPLHPYTAYLCSKLSNQVGSANRTVIKFMNDKKKGFPKFIEDENACNQKQLLTADWLWDFFYEGFDSDTSCSIFTYTYRMHEAELKELDGCLRVFKVILLLNALNSKFDNTTEIERLTPNSKNIKYIFEGDKIVGSIDEILDFFDQHSIVSKDVYGNFKIQSNNYNPKEIASAKAKIQADHKEAVKFLDYNQQARKKLTALFSTDSGHLYRPCDLQIYSCEEKEALLLSKLRKYTREKPNNLHIALFLSIADDSREVVRQYMSNFVTEFHDTILIIPEESLSKDVENKIIEELAKKQVSQNHHTSTNGEYEKVVEKHIEIWVSRLLNGTYTMYFNDERYNEGILQGVDNIINKNISPKIFYKGFEIVKKFHGEVPTTFFKTQNCPKLVINVLQAKDRDKLKDFTGDTKPARYIFEKESGGNIIDEQGELKDVEIKSSQEWIVKICKKMDEIMSEANKTYQDRFSLSEILAPFMKPPFGFFSTKANFVALTYALKKHKGDLFLPSTSQPISDEKLGEMITLLFQMWNKGESSANSKLYLRFGSPEESKLKNLIFEVFALGDIMSPEENKSLANAKWGVQEFCKKKSKQPLWTLKYCKTKKSELKEIIEQLIDLFEQDVPQIEKIKNVANRIEGSKIDLYQLLIRTNNYEEGFRNFVKSMDNVKIEESWWEDLLADIDTLPEEVAFRKESDVKTRILNFYIKKINGTKLPPPNKEISREENNEVGQESTSEEVKKQAKEKILGANMPNMYWRKFVMDLLEEKPEVAEFIYKYFE